MKTTWLILTLVVAAALTVPGHGGKDKGHDGDSGHVILKPDALKWGPAPPALPPGAQATVLAGDPTKPGTFVIRLKAPDGYKVPLHTHPSDENVTVLQGTLNITYHKGDAMET